MKQKHKIYKSTSDGEKGHCYDGSTWNECFFWKKTKKGKSKCMLFGYKNGIEKYASEALKICDEIYGMSYEWEV